MKKYHCCVPGCKTYDTVDNFVNMPIEPYWRDQWLAVISRKNWVVDASTLACTKHFEEAEFSVVTAVTTGKNGNKRVIKTLNNTKAIPSYFPKITTKPDYNPKRLYSPSTMFEFYPRDREGPVIFEDIENKDLDFVVDYWYLKMMYPEKLRDFLTDTWKVIATMGYTIFYTTDFSETPRIPSSIKIGKDLLVSVTLAGRHMDPLDLTWILPINGKLNRWSQLQMMLRVYGK